MTSRERLRKKKEFETFFTKKERPFVYGKGVLSRSRETLWDESDLIFRTRKTKQETATAVQDDTIDVKGKQRRRK